MAFVYAAATPQDLTATPFSSRQIVLNWTPASGAEGYHIKLADTPGGPYSIIASNIVAPFFLEHAGEVAALLRPGGVLLATGILEEEAPAVQASLARAGLASVSRHEASPWTLIAGRRTA